MKIDAFVFLTDQFLYIFYFYQHIIIIESLSNPDLSLYQILMGKVSYLSNKFIKNVHYI